MKIYQLLSLPALYNSISDKNLPFALAYKLSKLATQVNEELKFYQENLTKIIEEYGEKENGELVYLSNGDISMKVMSFLHIGWLLTRQRTNGMSYLQQNILIMPLKKIVFLFP